MTGIRGLATVSAALVVVQIALGAVVRLTGSGLACPDWPLCYGLWFPAPSSLAALSGVDYTFGQVMAEWTHRFNAAALVGPAILALLVFAWRRRVEAPTTYRLCVIAFLVLLAQAGLGGFTVLDRNSPWSVAAHLAAALLLLALLIGVRARTSGGIGRIAILPLAAALATAAAAASGAMTAKAGATLACPNWPLCDGTLLPPAEDPLAQLHFAHRLIAAAAVLLTVAAWWQLRQAQGIAARAAALALAAAAAQVLLGIVVLHIFSGGSLWPQVTIGVAHQTVAVGLFICLLVVALENRNAR